MESSTDEPQERPVSQPPAPPPSRQPFKTYGQNYRYAETFHNPFPEVVCVGPAPTTTAAAGTAFATTSGAAFGAGGNAGFTDAAANSSTTEREEHSSSFQHDTAPSKESVKREAVWVEPPETPWYKTISRRRWLAIIVCTVGITGVVLAILGAMNKLSGDSTTDAAAIAAGNGTSTMTDLASATSGISSASPTSTSTHSKPTIDCSAPKTFLTAITWVGTDVGKYHSEFAQASSPEACCRSCLRHGGCAGWLYNGTSAFTPCTKVVVLEPGQNGRGKEDGGRDKTCPSGYADVTYFTALDEEEAKGEAGKRAGVAGMGPCGLEMQVQ